MTAVATGTPGATDVHVRAIERTVVAIVHEALGVDAKGIKVRLDDDRGGLAVSITTPLPVPSLDGDPGTSRRGGPTVLERLHAARRTVVERMRDVAGREVTRVDIRISTATLAEQKRSIR